MLPRDAQIREITEFENTLYPSKAKDDDWKAVKISTTPENSSTDVYPCAFLSNYKPLLRMRDQLSPISLSLSIDRSGNTVFTSLSAVNAKDSILVDWNLGKVLPRDPVAQDKSLQLGESIPQGLTIFGFGGKFVLNDNGVVTSFPFRKNVIIQPLTLNREANIGFASIYTDYEPKKLQSILCISIKPPQILGEVGLPNANTSLASVYDPKSKVLIIGALDWSWMAMIDCSSKQKN